MDTHEKYRDIITVASDKEQWLQYRCTALPIPADGEPLPQHSIDMWELVTYNLMVRDNAVGLAANQIGLPSCVIAIRDGADIITMVNPHIVQTEGGLVNSIEGCLSCPGAVYKLRREKRVTVFYYNLCLRKFVTRSFTKRLSMIIQHELDHLNGITIDQKGKRQ